jgi:pimeloyl-ACP methyl ester carboxylesterase
VGPAPYTALLEAWAAHGYVVAAPEFPLTDQAIAGADLDESDIDNQPADVRFVTDYLVGPACPVANRIDATRVALAGHSDGAETALAAAVDPAPAGEPRYRALIAMAVQPVPGATGRNPPMLVTQGDADTINPPSYGYQTWALAASPKYLLVIAGGGHLSPLEAGRADLSGIEVATEAFLDVYVAADAPQSAIPSAVSHQSGLTLRAG